MPADPPHGLVILAGQPLVAEQLGVEVVDLKGRVMHMARRSRTHEERVMIDKLFAAVNVAEKGDLLLPARRLLFRHAHEVRGHEVEVPRVEADLLLQIGDAQAVVAELVHGGRAVVEALEGARARLFLFGVVDELLRQLARFGGALAVNQVDGEAFRVEELDTVAAAGSVS